MNRIAGVIVLAIGLLMVVLGFLEIVPGARQAGIFGIIVGAVAFGLSFVRRFEPSLDAPPPLSATERITGVFFEPVRVFQNLHWHPRWLAGFLVIAICGAI